MIHSKSLWHDRKRNVFGLPWTFTVYETSPDILYITTGFLSRRDDEIRLYRISDITLTESLWQRILHTGTIHCDSSDKTMQNFDIINIKNPREVKEMLSDMVEESRRRNHVYARENMGVIDAQMQEAQDADGDGIPDNLEPDDEKMNH